MNAKKIVLSKMLLAQTISFSFYLIKSCQRSDEEKAKRKFYENAVTTTILGEKKKFGENHCLGSDFLF